MKVYFTFLLHILFTVNCLSGQTLVTIAEIQGTGNFSSFNNDLVSISSVVVIARHDDMLFVQSSTPDNDLNTSEGILVDWNQAESFNINEVVNIIGRVRERDRNTIIEASTINTTGQSNSSIVPRMLSNDFPGNTRTNVNALESVEGQLVQFTNMNIVGPSQGSNLAYVSASDVRPMREPGLEFPGVNNLPEWDGNPEVFFFVPRGLGLAGNQFLHADMTISGTGVIVEEDFNYALYPISFTVTNENELPAVQLSTSNEFNVGCLNTLFLEREESNYDLRLEKITNYIIDQLGTPDVVALQEVGGQQEFIDLAESLSNATGNEYTAHFDNPVGNINNGYIVNKAFSVSNIESQGNNLTFSGGSLHDRPPLLLEGFIETESGPVPLSILNLHIRSLNGIDTDFVQQKRNLQAIHIGELVKEMQDENKEFFIVGDFNAFQFSDGYVDVLNQIAGTPSLGALLPNRDLGISPLTNVSTTLIPESEQYSFVFRGNAQILDHCLASDFQNAEVSHFHFGRGNCDYPEAYLEQASPFRATDHDGFAVYLDLGEEVIFGDGIPIIEEEAVSVSNPFTSAGRITFNLEERQNVQIDLFSVLGQLMYSTSIGAVDQDIVSLPELSNFQTGVYFMTITGNSLDFTKKILIYPN